MVRRSSSRRCSPERAIGSITPRSPARLPGPPTAINTGPLRHYSAHKLGPGHMPAHRIAAQGRTVHKGLAHQAGDECPADAVPIRLPDRRPKAVEDLVIPNFDLVESAGAES